jgi:hypothetical protein
MMKRLIFILERDGIPGEVLRIEEVPAPEVKSDELIVRIIRHPVGLSGYTSFDWRNNSSYERNAAYVSELYGFLADGR